MKPPTKKRCAWCHRHLDRVGICPKCAAIIMASIKRKPTNSNPEQKEAA